MTDYRRALQQNNDGRWAWEALWHFNETCLEFPNRNFAVRQDRPLDGDLCSQCRAQIH
jgi:hypothetical protein